MPDPVDSGDPASLVRPRLIRALLGRWQHRVTELVGGAGFGKTTLLRQALAENRLAPHGEDVWINVKPQDADGDELAQTVATALGRTGGGPSEPAGVADLVWRRALGEVCLVFDDVQRLPAGSAGASWLTRFVEVLPANGHVVLAGRVAPPVALARLRTQGEVLRVGQDDLLFSGEELAAFAAARQVDPARLAGTRGWPVLVELTASADGEPTGAYLWEEVLEPLGAERRHLLAVVCDLRGADDRLASAALGATVDLSRDLASVPLVTVGVDGWHAPDPLWNGAPGIALVPAERVEMRRRAVDDLTERGRLDEAYTLLSEVGLWDLAPAVLRAACLARERPAADRLGRWLSGSPVAVRTSPAGCLATGLRAAVVAPAEAIELLRAAAARCRDAGDVDAELVAIGQLERLAWFRQDPTVPGTELAGRVDELVAAGHPRAREVAAFGRAVVADLAGDDSAVLAELAGIESGALDPEPEALATWLCGIVRLGLGDTATVADLVERLAPTTDPNLRAVLRGLRLRAWWNQGRVDEVVDEISDALAAMRAIGGTAGTHVALASASVLYSHVGDIDAARRCLDEAAAAAPAWHGSDAQPPAAHTSLARAGLQLAEGDEDQAAASLRDAIDRHGLDRGADRRDWRHSLPLSYVLVPETRDHWDGLALRGDLLVARELAAAVVAARAGRSGKRLAVLEVPHPRIVRATLHHRLAAELAVGLAATGRSEGAALLDAIGPVGRAAVRSTAAARSPIAKPAKALLAAVPAAPPRQTYVAALGPLSLHRDGPHGEELVNADLRRRRVRELIAFLVGHRTTTRAAVTAALWPDVDERASSNNLAVTVCYLLRALEPWRPTGEPAYLVRFDGQSVKLVTDGHLRVDLDDFDDHLVTAAQAESDGTPSVALEHHLAAVGLYRDALCSDLPANSWITSDREYYSARFVYASTRAAQLLLRQNGVERAEALARRAIEVEPAAEEAYAVLVAAALARNDPAAAQRQLQHCVTRLADLGIAPSEATRQMHDRLGGKEAVQRM